MNLENYDTVREIKQEPPIHIPPILSKIDEYEDLNTDFIHGLLDKYLIGWKMNPKNKGHRPFVSIKIFQYDPERMKKTTKNFLKINPCVTVRKKRIKQKIKKKKSTTKSHQWVGEEHESKKVNEIVEFTETEVLVDESVHCHIENYEEMPIVPVYMINKQSNLITNNNIALFPSIKPLIDQFPDCTVISKEEDDYIERTPFDVESALELLESSTPVMIKHSVSKMIHIDPVTVEAQGDKILIHAPIQSPLSPLEECIGPERLSSTIIEFFMIRSLIRDLINPNMSIDQESKMRLNNVITKVHDLLMSTMAYQAIHYAQIRGREVEIYSDKPIKFIRSTMNGGYL